MTKELWSSSQWGQENCLCSKISRPAVRPYQSCIQQVLGLFLHVKWQRFCGWWLTYAWYWGSWVWDCTSTPPYAFMACTSTTSSLLLLNNEVYFTLHSVCWFVFRISKSQAVSVWRYAFRVNPIWHEQNIQCWDRRQIVPYQQDSCNWCAGCDYTNEKCWSRWGCIHETHYFNICSGSCILVNDFDMSWPFHMQSLPRVMKWVVPRLVTLVNTV